MLASGQPSDRPQALSGSALANKWMQTDKGLVIVSDEKTGPGQDDE